MMWERGERRRWGAGDWTIEVREDELADISFRGALVLRSVRAVVRDRNWDTAGLVIDQVDCDERALTLHMHSVGFGSDLHGFVRAELRDQSGLRILTDLQSPSGFTTNRTGLVVLHPHRLAGAELRIRHPDGSKEETRFPEAISPHQPARDITGLSWSDQRIDVRLRFAGDVFEMEDQRNWTDASYKTYSRPLALPFPYSLAPGEHVVQSIDVDVHGAPELAAVDPVTRVRLEEGPAFPAIGVCAATAPDPAPALPASLSDVPSAATTVLVEVDLATRNWRAALMRAAAASRPLDVRFVLADADHASIDDGVRALRGLAIARVTAFWPTGAARHISDRDAIAMLRRALGDAEVHTPVVGGARSHFTELNREHHRLPADLDGVVFSVTPLFHSLSTEQLIESLPIQRLVASQAVSIADGAPVHIGPISLRPHFNDVATTPPPMPEHADLRAGYGAALTDAADPRQCAQELAAWTVASAAALAVPGVETLTFFEEWGPRGIRDSDGEARPVHDAVSDLAALSGAAALRGDSPDGLVWAIGARMQDGIIVLLANLDAVERMVEIELPDAAVRSAAVPAGAVVRL